MINVLSSCTRRDKCSLKTLFHTRQKWLWTAETCMTIRRSRLETKYVTKVLFDKKKVAFLFFCNYFCHKLRANILMYTSRNWLLSTAVKYLRHGLKDSAYICQFRHLQSVLIFSILSYPCPVLVYSCLFRVCLTLTNFYFKVSFHFRYKNLVSTLFWLWYFFKAILRLRIDSKYHEYSLL